MNVLDDLRRLSAAEDFFAALDVPYDPAVLAVCRLHILKRMGSYLRSHEAELAVGEDDASRVACRAALAQAYADFVASSPLQERVFKVLREAVEPPAPSLVQLTAAPGHR